MNFVSWNILVDAVRHVVDRRLHVVRRRRLLVHLVMILRQH